jgi:hypothetical protein
VCVCVCVCVRVYMCKHIYYIIMCINSQLPLKMAHYIHIHVIAIHIHTVHTHVWYSRTSLLGTLWAEVQWNPITMNHITMNTYSTYAHTIKCTVCTASESMCSTLTISVLQNTHTFAFWQTNRLTASMMTRNQTCMLYPMTGRTIDALSIE